jgi:CubicO group peptidase (beta-lactamase class C family)
MRTIQKSSIEAIQQKRYRYHFSLLVFLSHMRHLVAIVGLGFILMLTCVSLGFSQTQVQQGPWPTIAWSKAKPEAVGMSSAVLKEAEQIYPRIFPSAYSLIVIRHGKIVSESYFHGQTAETSNHIYSITKTFSATLLGIAAKQGWIQGVHQRVGDLLPEYPIHPNLAALTLEDILTHRSGVKSSRAVSDISLFLKDEPQSVPGKVFEYSNYAPNLITALLDRLAKKGVAGEATDVPALANNYLFGPLGINVSEWNKGPKGVPDGGNGLYMSSRDLARLGYLMLRDGYWEDKQLLPNGWIKEATQLRAEFDREKGYGYLNWVRNRSDIIKMGAVDQSVKGYFAYGHRGQFIGVYPELDLLVITMADATDATRDTFFVPDLLHDYVRRFVFRSIIN